MTETPLESYLAGVRPDAHDAVRILAAAVDAADAGFDQRHTYGLLVYTFDRRWHDWVVAIGVTPKVVNLRFLYGQQLADPAGLLRPGSTTAGTIDYTSAADIDPELVTAYVREAVAKHPRS
jgi:hypothetical protein